MKSLVYSSLSHLHTCFLCKAYLPVFSRGVYGLVEQFVDCSHILLHYQITLLMFLSDQVVGLAFLLFAFSVVFW